MSPPKNLQRSIRAKLLNLARTQKKDFNQVLQRYAMERWLYRMAAPEAGSGEIVLKGAILLLAWFGEDARYTQDIDVLAPAAFGNADAQRLIQRLARVHLDDGVSFDASSFSAQPIAIAGGYQPLRVKFKGELAGARFTIQMDIGRGDAVQPRPSLVTLPCLLGMPAPTMMAYPREVAIAEKLQAMVDLGMNNSRLKDYGDLWVFLKDTRGFELERLRRAVRATFGRRQSEVPTGVPDGLSDAFWALPTSQLRWTKACKSYAHRKPPAELRVVVGEIRRFVVPIFEACHSPTRATALWAKGVWTDDL